jgi:uncharacterized protein YdhG (YjbR/CyaY superfamily)
MKADRAHPGNTDQYIAGFPRTVQGVLKRVRNTIRKAVPGAEETISYRIPTYKLHGHLVLYFAGWAHHYPLYPSTDRLVAALEKEFVPYELSRGPTRFRLGNPVPVKLIERISRFRAKEVVEKHELRPPRTVKQR